MKQSDLEAVFKAVRQKLEFRLKEKGFGILVSRHEIQGILAEEFKELMDALQDNDRNWFREELLDIAVGCIIGIASMDSKKMDW